MTFSPSPRLDAEGATLLRNTPASLSGPFATDCASVDHMLSTSRCFGKNSLERVELIQVGAETNHHFPTVHLLSMDNCLRCSVVSACA
jgi:hypothetical protein